MKRSFAAIVMMGLMAIATIAQQQQQRASESTMITGRVLNESGQPVPGINIRWTLVSGSRGQQTTTDSEGNFKIQGLDGGIYRINASAPGYVSDAPNTAFYHPGESVSLT